MAEESAYQEVAIPFGGKTYRLRPTYQIITRVEQLLSTPARTLGMRCMAAGIPLASRAVAEIGLVEMGLIMTALLQDQNGAPPAAQIGDILMEDGYGDLLDPVGKFLTRALRGNKEYGEEQRRLAELAAKASEKEAATEGAKDPPASQSAAAS